MFPLLLIAFVFVVAAIFFLLTDAGRGRRFITLEKTIAARPDGIWHELTLAADQSALTFRPVRALETMDTGDLSYIIDPEGRPSKLLVHIAADEDARSLTVRRIGLDGQHFPFGPGHQETWRVQPGDKGATLWVTARLNAGPLTVFGEIWRLWRAMSKLAADCVPKSVTGAKRNASAASGLFIANHRNELTMSLMAMLILFGEYGLEGALILAGVILVHEYGHFLAFQLTGLKGNKMMLVPFIGGLAVPGGAHRNEYANAFCSLMGPGICVPLSLGAYFLLGYVDDPGLYHLLSRIAIFSASLNMLNLLPVFPLDGGQFALSMLRSYFGQSAFAFLVALSCLSIYYLIGAGQGRMVMFIVFLGLPSWRYARQPSRLAGLSGVQSLQMLGFYGVSVTAHGWVFSHYMAIF